MTDNFGATSTTDDVLAGVDLSGKRILVTGASTSSAAITATAAQGPLLVVIGAAATIMSVAR